MALKFDLYDRITNAIEHLTIYQHAMCLISLPHEKKVVMCMFPTSLKGAALTWFDSLEFESINSFEELVNQFRAQFASSIKIRKVANHLFTIVQGKFESLSLTN